MNGFFKKAVVTGNQVLIDKINKDSDEMAKAKATSAYVPALAKDPKGNSNRACFEVDRVPA